MKSVWKWIVLLVLCVAQPAAAQIIQQCAVDPIPPCRGPECKCISAMRGDPVNMILGKTLHAKKDVSIDTGFGQFELWRYYSSSVRSAHLPQSYGGGFPLGAQSPFGSSVAASWGPSWSHDLFSFVDTQIVGSIMVYDGTFHWLEFADKVASSSGNNPDRAFLVHGPYSAGRIEGLERTTIAPFPSPQWESYRLIRKDGVQWIYNTPNGNGLTFLSEVRNATGQFLYSIQYENPTVAGIANCGGGVNGTPFISHLDFAAGGKLRFSYGPNGDGTQCVLTSLSFAATASSAPTVVSAYSYQNAPAGKVASGGPTNGGPMNELEVYSYSASALSVQSKDGPVVYVQTYVTDPTDATQQYVSSYSGVGASESFQVSLPKNVAYATGGDKCAPSPGSTAFITTTASVSASGGSSTAPPTVLTATYYGFPDEHFGGSHSAVLEARVDSCGGGTACSAGSYVEHRVGVVDSTASCSSTNPAASLIWKDKRGNWSGEIRRVNYPDEFVPSFHAKGSDSAIHAAQGFELLEYTYTQAGAGCAGPAAGGAEGAGAGLRLHRVG